MGNTKGWILAALVLVIEIAGVYLALGLDDVSPPSAVGRDATSMATLSLPVDPRTIVKTDETGDAGPLYRSAVDAYLAEPAIYETYLRDRGKDQLAKLSAIEDLLAATHLRGGNIYAATPDAVVVYGESAQVQALASVGKACYLAGQTFERREPATAQRYYEAAFSLGMRMFDERLSYRQLLAGVTLMSEAGARLAQVATKTNRIADAAAIIRFTDAQRDYMATRIVPSLEAIYTFNEAKIAEHAGDVFVFAGKSQERLWRIEAILKLGRMKYNVGIGGRPGNQRHAARLATRLAETETDPAVKHAAVLAREMTVEEFRMLRP